MNIYQQISQNKLKTYFIFAIFIAFFSGVFYLIGQYYNSPTTFFFLGAGLSLATSFGSYFFSDKLVLTMAHARPASKEEFFDFYTVTENLSIAAGIPMPKLYVIDDDAPNAFATGRDQKHAVVAASTGLLSRLRRAEIEGVIAHELSHIKNYDMLVMTIVAVLVGTLVYATDFITRSMWFGGDDDNKSSSPIAMILLILTLLISPLLASLIQLAISRRREYLADASAALLTRNPDGLADALEKIAADYTPSKKASNALAHLYFENPFQSNDRTKKAKWLTNLFSTHPPVEDRVRILREM